MGLAVGFLLRHLPALVREHQPPAHHAHDQQQGRKDLDEGRLQHGCGGHRRAQVKRHHVARLCWSDQAKTPASKGVSTSMINKNCPSSVSTRRQTKAGTSPPNVAPLLGPTGRGGLHRS